MRKLKPMQARLAGLADLLIRPIVALPRLFVNRKGPEDAIRRILVVELWRIGDIVIATPALQALRRGHPNARIVLLASPQALELLKHQDVVDEIIPFMAPWVEHHYALSRWRWRELWRVIARVRSERFDLALDFRGDLRDNLLLWLSGAPRRVGFAFAGGGSLLTDVVPAFPNRHQSVQALDVVATLGVPSDALSPRLWTSAEEQQEARSWLEQRGVGRAGRPVVAIHPGARWQGRRWAAERFVAVADWILAQGSADVVLVGGPDDGPLLDTIAMAVQRQVPVAQPSLRQLVALLAACDLLVCVDSGAMHVSTAVGTPVVALFGPQRPEWFGPIGGDHVVAMADVPCRPCDQIVCHRPNSSCMCLLEVPSVIALVAKQIQRCRARKRSGRPFGGIEAAPAVSSTGDRGHREIRSPA